MSLWLVRAGKHGEHEVRFLDTKRVYLTWNDLATDLATLKDVVALRDLLHKKYTDLSEKAIINHASQIWAFAHVMKKGDWVVVPRKSKPTIAIGEVTGPYHFQQDADNPYYHSRAVRWLSTDVPRSSFSQDLLYSFGAFMTICQIARNDAEKRVRAMEVTGWRPEGVSAIAGGGKSGGTTPEGEDTGADLEPLGRDQIAKLVGARFKGHNLTRLVEGILQAQGYRTFRSPAGPDKGVDILAAPGALGFDQPAICVQVKSDDGAVDHPTFTQLVGAMQSVGAEKGLFVAWGGFKSSVEKETAGSFFTVRLWNQAVLIDELLSHYDKLSEDLRSELPLKRIWTVVPDEDEVST